MTRTGKIYPGKRIRIESRNELPASIHPQHWKHVRPDTGDMPDSILTAHA
jgi:hypothetical protein